MTSEHDNSESAPSEEPVLAEMVTKPEAKDAHGAPDWPDYAPAVSVPGAAAASYSLFKPPSLAQSGLDNMAAKGGAYGSFVLGIWAALGSLVTPWSSINGILGLLLSVWGLTSHHQKISWIGIILSLLGIVLSFVGFSDMIQAIMPVDEMMQDETF